MIWFRWAWHVVPMLVAVILFCRGSSADCVALPGQATINQAVVTVIPQEAQYTVTVAGVTDLDPPTRDVSPRQLCRAVIGELKLNTTPICADDNYYSFTSEDHIDRANNALKFSLVRTFATIYRHSIVATSIDNSCPHVVYRIELQQGRSMAYVSPMPDKMNPSTIVFNTGQSGDGDLSSWQVWYNALTKNDVKTPPVSALPIDSSDNSAIRDLVRGLTAIVLLLVGLHLGVRRVLAQSFPLDEAVFSPVTAGLVMLACSTFMYAATGLWLALVRITQEARFDSTFLGTLGKVIHETNGSNLQFSFLQCLAVGGPLVLLALAFGIIGLRRRGDIVQATVAILFRGTLLALAGTVLALLTLLSEIERPIGYEIPAIIVSAAIAYVGASSFQKRFGLKLSTVIGVTVLAAATILFPAAPLVLEVGGTPTAGANTLAWIPFVSLWSAKALISLGLFTSGFFLMRVRTDQNQLAIGRGLLVLFLLCVVDLRSIGITDALALIGVWAVADSVLFRITTTSTGELKPDSPERTVLDTIPDVQLRRSLGATALLGGALAVLVFWFQYSLRPIDDIEFATLFATNVLLTAFAKGALGVLLLGCAFNMLQGSAAVTKAAVLVAVAIAASLAADLQGLMASRHALPTIIGNLDLLSALLLVAVFAYDIPNARRQAGDLPLGDLFKGTSLGRVVPVVIGIATAIFTAVIPAMNMVIGKALGDFLAGLIPHVK